MALIADYSRRCLLASEDPRDLARVSGAGILQAQRDDDPFAVTTQIRTLWR